LHGLEPLPARLLLRGSGRSTLTSLGQKSRGAEALGVLQSGMEHILTITEVICTFRNFEMLMFSASCFKLPAFTLAPEQRVRYNFVTHSLLGNTMTASDRCITPIKGYAEWNEAVTYDRSMGVLGTFYKLWSNRHSVHFLTNRLQPHHWCTRICVMPAEMRMWPYLVAALCCSLKVATTSPRVTGKA
jgi:hypothetical protein